MIEFATFATASFFALVLVAICSVWIGGQFSRHPTPALMDTPPVGDGGEAAGSPASAQTPPLPLAALPPPDPARFFSRLEDCGASDPAIRLARLQEVTMWLGKVRH